MTIPIAVGSLIEVVLYGRSLGQVETRNTFSYEMISIDPTNPEVNDLENVPSAFWVQILTAIRAFTSSSHIYYQVEAKLIDKTSGDSVASEFYTIPAVEQSGQVTGDMLPPQVAGTFQFVRPNSTFRHGYVRFGGIAETFNVNGALGAAGNGTNQAATLAAALQANIGVKVLGSVNLDAGEIQPRLVQYQFNGDQVRPVRTIRPISVRFSRLGSQNSRKFGVGS